MKVNGQPIPNGSPIEFNGATSVVVRFKVEFLKPDNLTIGGVSQVIGTKNSLGEFIQLFPIQNLFLGAGNTGFNGTWEKTLYASDYTYESGNYLTSILHQTDALQSGRWETNRVPINRGPNFVLNYTTLSIPCGDTSSRTFTLTNLSSSTGSILYNWNIGTGWTGVVNSNMSSITLTPINGNILPSNVSVTPIYNGVTQPYKVCSVTRAPFSNSATLAGNAVICPGENSVYTISGLGVGNTVTWSSSNNSVATVSGGTLSEVTVNGLSNGNVNLIATVTNSCGQTAPPIIKTINIGAPVMPNGTIYGELWVRKNFFPQTLTFPAVLGATSYTWTITPNEDFPPSCPATGSVPAKFSNNLQTIITTTPSATASFGNCLGTYNVTCTISNACGSTVAYIRYVTVGNSGTSPCFVDYSISKAYTLIQNPIKNGDIKIRKSKTIQIEDIDFGDDIPESNIVDGDGPCYQEWPIEYNGLKMNPNVKNAKQNSQVDVKVFDFYGKQVYTKTLNVSVDEISIKDSNLNSGKYILHINDGINTQKEIIIIE